MRNKEPDMRWRTLALGTGLAALAVMAGAGARAQMPHGGHGHGPAASTGERPGAAAPTQARPPRRVTMEELHRSGGVPRGWKFTVPPGDPAKGRQLFADLECYQCHAVSGEGFPPAGRDPKSVGPELTGMGGVHPAEYLAESILAPNHVIVDGPGFTGPDGLSIMPSFADSLSLAQWLDVVAYLKSLTQGGDAPHSGREVERQQIAGAYRIRLVYAGADGAHGDHGGHGAGRRTGHLMAFVLDREDDAPVPYLPVSAAVEAAGQPPRTLRLQPMLDDQGFHYGADLTLPDPTRKITLTIGTPALRTVGPARTRYAKPVSAVFEWTPARP
jgi:mono/diheme cytochrome c family protein